MNKFKIVQLGLLVSFFYFPDMGKCSVPGHEDYLVDTLFVDSDIEELNYYVHNYIENGKYVVNGTKRLKHNKTKTNFSGVIAYKHSGYIEVFPDEEATFTDIMVYKDGIPHGQWKRYAGNKLIIFDLGVNMGYLNGICKYYEYESSMYAEKNYSVTEVGYLNGFMEGIYRKSVYGNRGYMGSTDPINDYKILIERTSCKLSTKNGTGTCRGILYENLSNVDLSNDRESTCFSSLSYVTPDRVPDFDDIPTMENSDFIKNATCGSATYRDYTFVASDYEFFSIKKIYDFMVYSVDIIKDLVDEDSENIDLIENKKIIYKNNLPVKYSYYYSLDTSVLNTANINENLKRIFKNNMFVVEEDTLQYYKGYIYRKSKDLLHPKLNFSNVLYHGWPYYLPEDLMRLVPNNPNPDGGFDDSGKSYDKSGTNTDTLVYAESKDIFIGIYDIFSNVRNDNHHGFHAEFDNPAGFHFSIENKFSANADYMEGEYFFGEKTGIWNYYIFVNGEKRKIASEKYALKIPANLVNFKLGMAVIGAICNEIPQLSKPIITEKIIYNYENGKIIIGFYYDTNGNVIKVVK